MRLIDLTGKRFTRLTVETYLGGSRYECRCDCGTVHTALASNLKRGLTRSCGCLNQEMRSARTLSHGMTESAEYRTWRHIKSRCLDPAVPEWKYYGGRGIGLCDEWRDSFDAFYKDVGPRPSAQHSIDRIDVNGPYRPGNVRWATRFEQANNTRRNCRITWRGVTKTVHEWAAIVGLPPAALYLRVHRLRWDAERALTQPIDKAKGRRRRAA